MTKLVGMPFDSLAYGEAVARILALDGSGERPMPLALGTCSSGEAHRLLGAARAPELFRGARAPEAALSGLWLYFSCLDESHSLSQGIHTAEGSFWHAIMHRQEPDPANSGYWFRRVGTHPVFPAIAEAAAAAGYSRSGKWDPAAFIDFVEDARSRPGSREEAMAVEIQRREWQILFDYCASPVR